MEHLSPNQCYGDEDRRLLINDFLERTSGLLTSTGAASKRTVEPSRSLIVQNWLKIVLPTRDTKDKKKPPGVSETTMAYFKVAFQAISEAVDGDLAKGWYISCCR